MDIFNFRVRSSRILENLNSLIAAAGFESSTGDED